MIACSSCFLCERGNEEDENSSLKNNSQFLCIYLLHFSDLTSKPVSPFSDLKT